VEAEVKKLKTSTSAVLQTVTTTFSDSMDMNMQGHMVYEIAPLVSTLAGSSPTRSMLFIEPLVL
jgi:hypothetical protein